MEIFVPFVHIVMHNIIW